MGMKCLRLKEKIYVKQSANRKYFTWLLNIYYSLFHIPCLKSQYVLSPLSMNFIKVQEIG